MRSSRRRVLIGMGGMLAAPFVAGPSFGQDAEFRLKLHHFLARNGNVPAKFIAPWARKIETESKGRIKIDIFPSMQLGGSPQQLFDQARDGVADIVWTLPAYTAGRFPTHRGFRSAVHRGPQGRSQFEGPAGVLGALPARRIQGGSSRSASSRRITASSTPTRRSRASTICAECACDFPQGYSATPCAASASTPCRCPSRKFPRRWRKA